MNGAPNVHQTTSLVPRPFPLRGRPLPRPFPSRNKNSLGTQTKNEVLLRLRTGFQGLVQRRAIAPDVALLKPLYIGIFPTCRGDKLSTTLGRNLRLGVKVQYSAL